MAEKGLRVSHLYSEEESFRLEPDRSLLVFHLAGQAVALPLESISRITPMARLARPPGMPSALEGILNLAGVATPVLRIDRLLGLPPMTPGLYSMLIVLRGVADSLIALLVDRVSGVLSVPGSALIPIAKDDSFNGCAEWTIAGQNQPVHVLSPARILL